MLLCLVVDDDRILCEATAYSLSAWGAQVVTKTNGLEALEWCKRNTMPTFIILDMKMPQIDGFSFIQTLHKMPDGKKPMIIASTGLNDAETVQKLARSGLSAYLVKPYKMGKLKETLKKLGAFIF